MSQAEKVKIVAKILRKRFIDLPALEATHVAYSIVEALDKSASKVEAGDDRA